MNQLVIASLATLAGVSLLLAMHPKAAGVHCGGIIFLLCTAAGSLAGLIVFCVLFSA